MASAHTALKVNRAPVLTLGAAVVAERLGFDRAEALTLGLFQPAPKVLDLGRIGALARR